MSHCIGIDLGTSTTCVAVIEDGEPYVIPGSGNEKIIPSYIHFREDGRILIGDPAKAEAIADPYNTIWATKRLLGRKFNDPGVQECLEKLPYRIASAANGEILIQGRDKTFTPEWAASALLKFAANQASKYLKSPVKHAVITVPGSFDEAQRAALGRAAQKAGIEVMRLVNEPTAAALAWGFHKRAEQTIAVFDLGGGTFDVSILKIGNGGYHLLASKSDPWLGGEDFDNLLVDRVVKDFQKKWRINIYADKIAHQRLKLAAETAKIVLSSHEQARLYVPSICPDVSRVADVNLELSREEFEAMIEPLVNRAVRLFTEAAREAGVELGRLDNLLLVGGMTRVPLVRRKIEEAIGRPANADVNPDEAVAMGAAVIAAGVAGVKIALSPPVSTRLEDEYLSGDVDVHAMYDTALQNQQRQDEPGQVGTEWSAAAAAAPSRAETRGPSPVGTLPLQSAVAGAARPARPATQMLLEVSSSAVTPEAMAQAFAAAVQSGGPVISGGVMIGPNPPEEIRIKIFQEGPAPGKRMAVGEFVIVGYQAAPNEPPRICVYYQVDRQARFAVKAAPSGPRPRQAWTGT